MPVWYHGGDARATIGWFHGAGVLMRTDQPPRRDLVSKPGRPYRSRPQETGRNGYLAASRRGRWTVLEIEMLLDSHFQAFLSRFCPIEGISAKPASSRCTSIDTFDLAPPSEHPGSFFYSFKNKNPLVSQSCDERPACRAGIRCADVIRPTSEATGTPRISRHQRMRQDSTSRQRSISRSKLHAAFAGLVDGRTTASMPVRSRR